MPTLENPYASSFAGPLSNLAKAFMTGPTEAEKITQAENALKLQRQRQGVTDLASAFMQFGSPGFNRNAAMSAAITGGYKPDDLAGMERYGAANTYGATDARTTNAAVGAGGAYSGTAHGFREGQRTEIDKHNATIAEQQRQFDMKPFTVGSPSGPVVSTNRDAVGQPAVEDIGKVKGDVLRRGMNAPGGIPAMSPDEKTLVGVDSKTQPTPRNYLAPGGAMYQTYDGVTDARTGQPLPAGGAIAGVQGTPDQSGLRPNTRGDLERANIENQKFRGLLDYTKTVASDPNNFGIPGFIKGLAQDVTQLSDGLARGLGYNGLAQAVEEAKTKAAASGVSPQLLPGLFTFDPRLPQLHTASDLLVYQAASALAGQSGRSVSDKDVKLFQGIVGDPREWLTNQEKYLSKLDTIEQILNVNQGVIDKNLRGGQAPAAAPAAPGASPTPPAPGAPQFDGAKQAPDGNWYVPDPNRPGKYMQVQP